MTGVAGNPGAGHAPLAGDFSLSSILVGMVGVHLLRDGGIVTSSHKAMNLGAVLLGGALVGGGWAGMVTGAALYAELYPFFKTTVLAWEDYGKIGLPETRNP